MYKKSAGLTVVLLLAAMGWRSFGAEPEMLGIFTDHCRSVFAQGEEIEVSVAARAGAALDGQLELKITGPNLSYTLAQKEVHLNAGQKMTVSYRVRPEITALLKPATYELKASVGRLESLGFPLQIVSTQKATHLVLYEANWSGTRDYGPSVETLPKYVWGYASLHHNLAMDLSNIWANKYDPLKNPLHVPDTMRLAVPEEWLLEQDSMDLANEELLRYGMGRVIQLHGVWCRTLRLGLDQNLRDYLHTYATAVQNWKRYPNILGLSYGDDLNTLGDWESGSYDAPQSDIHFQERMRFWIADFARCHPELNVTRETLMPANEKIWHAWIDYITERFPEAELQWRQALQEEMTNYITTSTEGPGYGMNIAAGNYLAKLNRHHTVIQSKTEADIGTYPFQAETTAEYLKAGKGDQPVWEGSWGRMMEGTSTIAQRAVSLLGRRLDGVGPFDMTGMMAKNEGFEAAMRFSWGRRDRNKLVGELCTRYGDLCLGLNLDADVAVLFSYSQTMFDLIPASWNATFRTTEFSFNPELAFLNQRDVVQQAFVDFTRAGYVTRIVVEEDLLANRLPEYKAVVLVGLTHPLPEGVMSKIAAFQAQGGKVFVDDQTTSHIPGAIKLGLKFNQPAYEAWKQRLKAFRAPVAEHETPHALLYRLGAPHWPVIQEKLKFIEPFVTRDDPHVLFTTQSWGTGKYLFVWHDTVPPGWDEKRFWLPNSQWIYPIQTQLKLKPGDYTVYDIFSQREVPLQTEGGEVVLPVDFRSIEGRIFAVLPVPITGASLATPDTLTTGERLPVTVRVLGSDRRPINAMVSVQITLRNSKGEKVAEVYRAAAGSEGCREEFLVGVNEDPGTWTVEAKDLFSGHWARKTIRVHAGKLTASPKAVFEVPEVVVFNLAAIQQLVRRGHTVDIALDDGQETYRALADSLCSSLKARGVESRVVKMSEVTTSNDWNNCINKEGRMERWFTTDLPDATTNLILLSGEKRNRQVLALDKHSFCSRPLTPNYPGRGRGLIDYSWSPFTGGYDVIMLAANDDEGLEKAVVEFTNLVNGRVAKAVIESQSLAQNLEHVRTAMLPPKVASRPAQGTFTPPVNQAKLTERNVTTGISPEDYVAHHFGDGIMALAASPDGRYIVAGTTSYFNNLFLLDDTGKTLWATKLGPIFVDKVAVANDGAVVAADLVDGLVRVFQHNGKTLHTFSIKPQHESGRRWLFDPFAVAPEAGVLLLNEPDRVECVRLDGRKLWEYQPPAGQRVITIQLGAQGTIVTLGCWNEYALAQRTTDPPEVEKLATLVRLGARDGRELWRVAGVAADSLAVTADGRFTVTSGIHDLTVLDKAGQVIRKLPSPHQRVAISDDGRTICSANSDGRTGSMVLDTGICVTAVDRGDARYVPTGDVIGDLIFGKNGTCFAYSWDGLIYRVDIMGKMLGKYELGAGARLVALPDGDLVAGSNAGVLTRLTTTGQVQWRIRLPMPDLDH